MILNLTNFRCYSSKSLSIPDEGIILLHGTSGAGKTTIMKAINHALYGNERKYVKYNEKKSVVELIYKDLRIIRTKTTSSTHLKLEYQDKIYENDIAQSIINKIYGTNFKVTSYVAQKSIESFLSLTAAQKNEFFNQLAIKDVNIANFKEQTKNTIKARKELVNNKSNEIRILRNQLENFNIPAEVEYPLKSGEYNEDEIDKEKRNNKANYDKLASLYKEQKNLLSKLDVMNKLKADYEKSEMEIKLLSEQLNNYKIELESIKQLDTDYKKINKIIYIYLLYLDGKIEYESEKSEIQNYTRELLDKYNKEMNLYTDETNNLNFDSEYYETIKYICNNKKNLMSITNDLAMLDIELTDYTENRIENMIIESRDNIKNIDKDISDIENQIYMNENHLHNLKKDKSHTCPKCESNLLFIDNNLAIHDIESNKRQQKILTDKIKILNRDLEIKKNVKNELQNIFRILDKLQDNIHNKYISVYVQLKDETDFDEEYVKLKDISEKYEKLNSRLSSVRQTIEALNNGTENSIVLKRNKLSKIKSRYDASKIEKQTIFVKYNDEELIESINKLLIEYDSEFEVITALDDFDEFEETDIKDVLSVIKDNVDRKIIEKENKDKQKEKIINKIEEINSNINRLRNIEFDIQEYTELLNRKEQLVNDIEEKEKRKMLYDKRCKKLDRYLAYHNEIKRYNQLKDSIETCEKEEKVYIKSLSVAEKFYKMLTDAETISISNTLENININIKYYMEHFFPEGNMEMNLTPFKDNKKGDKQTGLDIEIFYNGEKTVLDCLSGGEYDRCLLVLFLSFNSMVNSDLIMLDECLSSLNGELVEEIIDILKNTLKGKLVLVTLHQANVGIFDNVINL